SAHRYVEFSSSPCRAVLLASERRKAPRKSTPYDKARPFAIGSGVKVLTVVLICQSLAYNAALSELCSSPCGAPQDYRIWMINSNGMSNKILFRLTPN